ncbi:uncharacterized protein LOC113167647 [Anabas testudineus]|uniref:uncharacterized protein LOC113167647 n=1 Tax=Anabas testudineus TaxID=64144 RepID=UPI000E46038C|nr:uncharacterized protein LOC113167647 [Anabas testudineus]
MKIQPFLLFCFFSVLCNGNSGVIQAMLITKTEGEDFRDSFKVDQVGNSRLYLCKNNCSKEDILIETSGNRAQSGRYTVRYDGELYVTITELTQSDSGQYSFGVSNSSVLGSYKTFELRITERCDGGVIFGEQRLYSVPEGGNVTVKCSLSSSELNKKFLCRDECKKVLFESTNVKAKSDRYNIEYGSRVFFNVTITQLTQSDSGQYRCGVGRLTEQNTCQQFEISVTNGSVLPLVVSLIVIVLLAAFLLLLYKWKIGTKCNYVNSRGTSTSGNTQFAPHDNDAPSFILEEPPYDTVNPSSSYQILHQLNTDHDQLYSTLE